MNLNIQYYNRCQQNNMFMYFTINIFSLDQERYYCYYLCIKDYIQLMMQQKR